MIILILRIRILKMVFKLLRDTHSENWYNLHDTHSLNRYHIFFPQDTHSETGYLANIFDHFSRTDIFVICSLKNSNFCRSPLLKHSTKTSCTMLCFHDLADKNEILVDKVKNPDIIEWTTNSNIWRFDDHIS